MEYPDIENYVIFDQYIGRGGHGKVWKVRNAKGTVYALKLIEYTNDEYEGTVNEINTIKNVAMDPNCSVNLACYHWAGLVSYDKKPYIAILMDYYNGINIREYFNLYRPNMKQIYHIINDLFTALYELHRRGIYHRDIKHPNIVATHRGKIYLIDFGLSCKKYDCEGIPRNLPFLAPEYYTKKYPYSPEKYDIYALGMVLAMCITYYNFERKDKWEEVAFRNSILEGMNSLKRVDERVYRIIMACISDNPRNRPDAYTVLTALRR